MIVDGRQLPDGATLQGSVVIVGAGPAGIVLALELADAGVDVLLLESGCWKPDAAAQRLGDAELADPLLHATTSITTRRQIGGTSTIWGGRCVPFDPIDFEARDYVTDARWPVGYDDLSPYFQRACDWLLCGRAVFDADAVPSMRGRSLVPGLRDGPVRTSEVERWSLPADFGREYGRRLRKSPNVRLVTRTVCTEVIADPDAERPRVAHLAVRGLDRRHITVSGRRYVLACGGLETTRLLLASRSPGGAAIGDHAGHLGRWYMAHIEGGVADVHFTTPPEQTGYDYERDRDGVYVRRRITFAPEFQREHQLPNVVAWLANPELADPSHRSGALSLAYLALRSPLGPRLAPDAQRRSLTGDRIPGAPYGAATEGPVRQHLRNLVSDLGATLRLAGGFGVRRCLPGRHAPGFFVYSPSNTYPLQYHAEHMPNRASRVALSDDRDALGMPRLVVDLRFTEADVDGVVRAHQRWDEHLRRCGVGHLRYRSPDVAGDIWERIGGGFHQSGTTRMSRAAADGVVDANLAVHGFDDLFVASSSTFVTSSQANSTFTIIAFALRLADHLRREGPR
jgi:choline dehydrogenase-like flavoprotein